MIFILAIAAFISINSSHMTYERFNNQQIEAIAYVCTSGECA